MDYDDDGVVSARGLSVALGLSVRGDAARRLRALYAAHAPPLLPRRDLMPTHFTDTGEELAADAISFFDSTDDEVIPEPGPLQRSISEVCGDGTPMDKSDSETSQIEVRKPSPSPSKETEAEGVWSITLEQFLATMLSQPALEEFFNEKVSILPELELLRQRDRLQSVS
ncbi:hypothetical protein HF086_009787 [Spodoptera exigua]|uniref:Uncharacterized protein n=1 Tax=Spodoptera exigua TaxID=7107 RepID=A0A922SNT3_SPOEX|nr:hypothetical protein HF086_009787 [Spodoptera exigua]